MIFFAYDLEEFSNKGRGFYEDYISYVPGPVAKSCEELIDIINKKGYSIERIRKFNKENFLILMGRLLRELLT